MSKEITFGSVCSGIEAAQLAFNPFGFKQLWSSEISEFPSKVLAHHYPSIPNLGDMTKLPGIIAKNTIEAPDILCGGTPCQSFSLAGWKEGLADERGQLTMSFIDIANEIDVTRKKQGKKSAIILWENVEGVLNDRTNAFGNFIAGLAGFDEEIKIKKWSKSGYLEGPKRKVAWRVLDSKYFGLPQQRKRLYVLASGYEFYPDQVLFEYPNEDIVTIQKAKEKSKTQKTQDLFSSFIKAVDNKVFYNDNTKIEIFREYTDCLYSAYGTKWNGNAAAYNGSLYVAQNDRIRRFTPSECEKLMGFSGNYTEVEGNSDTSRFQAIGNSWAVPVVKWIGKQINHHLKNFTTEDKTNYIRKLHKKKNNLNAFLLLFDEIIAIKPHLFLNTSAIPNNPKEGSLEDIIETNNIPEKFYLSQKACRGILRRKNERNINMNNRLEELMSEISEEKVQSEYASL